MEKQNVTIVVPKETLKKAKHMAIDKQVSLSRLLTETLESIVEKDDAYRKAKARQTTVMKKGLNLGIGGNITWDRKDLHDR